MGKLAQIHRFLQKLKLKHVHELLYYSDLSQIPEVSPGIENLSVRKVQRPHTAGIIQVDRRLNKSNCCYYIWDGNNLVHQNWIFFKSHILRQFGFQKLPLIGDGFTLESFRGRGIQPFVLTNILRDLAGQGYEGAYTLVSPSNEASRRGVEKAGFILRANLKGSRLFGIYFHKRIA